MPFLSEDNISPNLLFFLALVCIDPFNGAQAPPFRTRMKTPLRVDPERTRGFRLGSRRVDIDQKSFWIEGVKVEEGGPIVGRFGKGLAFDLENGI
jgi:hypothetical protein